MCSFKKNPMCCLSVLLFVLFCVIKMCICAKSCPQSLMTKQYVPYCPQTKAAWDEAAVRKNCSAVKQSCTSPDNFVYHCLVNSYQNKLIEVCGVRTPITFPVCAEYNEGGNLVQENHFTDCSGYSPPCPSRYQSTDAYKYPDCYIITDEVTTKGAVTADKITICTTATNTDKTTKVNIVTQTLCEHDGSVVIPIDGPVQESDRLLQFSQLLMSGIVSAGITLPFMSIIVLVLVCSRRNLRSKRYITETHPDEKNPDMIQTQTDIFGLGTHTIYLLLLFLLLFIP